jgi:hypothetical protein
VYANGTYTNSNLEVTGESTLCELTTVGTDYAALYGTGAGPYQVILRRHTDGIWQAAEALLPGLALRPTDLTSTSALGSSLFVSWMNGDEFWGVTGAAF